MIFRETLNRLLPEVEEALDELFAAVVTNQTHEQDLLLIGINGCYYEERLKWNINTSPFSFGPGDWSYETDHTQARFFNSYRKQIRDESRAEFYKLVAQNPEIALVADHSVQTELSIYQKFWESNRMLKRLYHLSNLGQGKNYDWYYDSQKPSSRQKIIRTLIRDPLEIISPKFYALLKDIYHPQIRNAVAHSEFYIVGTTLGFNNYDVAKHHPLTQISFELWEERFHRLILLYNGLIKRFNASLKEYILQQDDKEFGLQIRLTNPDGTTETRFIKYVDVNRPDWMWYNHWKKNHKNK